MGQHAAGPSQQVPLAVIWPEYDLLGAPEFNCPHITTVVLIGERPGA